MQRNEERRGVGGHTGMGMNIHGKTKIAEYIKIMETLGHEHAKTDPNTHPM